MIVFLVLFVMLAGCNGADIPYEIAGYEASYVEHIISDASHEIAGYEESSADYIMAAPASAGRNLPWQRLYAGDEFLGLRLESFQRGTPERTFRHNSFVPSHAQFYGEIAVIGQISIFLRSDDTYGAHFVRFIVPEEYFGLFPILTGRGSLALSRLEIVIRNSESVLELFGLEPPETGFQDIAVHDVTAVISDFSVSDLGFYYIPPMEGYFRIISHAEPRIEVEMIDACYITVISHADTAGFRNLRVGDEFLGLTVERAESQHIRTHEDEDFWIAWQSAEFSGHLRLRGSMILFISKSEEETHFHLMFGASRAYFQLIPNTAESFRGHSYWFYQNKGNADELHQLLSKLDICFDEIEFEQHPLHRSSEIEIPDLYITLGGFEMIDERRFAMLYFRFENLHTIEIIR